MKCPLEKVRFMFGIIVTSNFQKFLFQTIYRCLFTLGANCLRNSNGRRGYANSSKANWSCFRAFLYIIERLFPVEPENRYSEGA